MQNMRILPTPEIATISVHAVLPLSAYAKHENSEFSSTILIRASKVKYRKEAEATRVENSLKTKSGTLVETSRTVVISSKVGDIESVDEVSREERKKEAGKPLYLIRYE